MINLLVSWYEKKMIRNISKEWNFYIRSYHFREITFISNSNFPMKQAAHRIRTIWIALLSYLTQPRSNRGLNDEYETATLLSRGSCEPPRRLASENIRRFSSGCHSQTTSGRARAIPALSASRIYGAPLDTPPDGSSIFCKPTFRHFGSVLPDAHKYSHLAVVLREPP